MTEVLIIGALIVVFLVMIYRALTADLNQEDKS